MSLADTNSANLWNRLNVFRFVLQAIALQIPIGAVSGKVLTCTGSSGFVEWGSTLPATTSANENGSVGITSTLVTGAGDWLVTVYHDVETAGAAGVLDTSLTYSDEAGAVTIYPVVSLPLTEVGRDQSVQLIRVVSGGIDFAVSPTGGAGGYVWNAFFSATKVRA